MIRDQIPKTIKKLTCFKNVEISEFLPAISVTNVRSLRPKFQNFIQDFRMRELTIACITETWGKEDKSN